MKCARCGSTLTEDAMVCGNCGGVVGASYGPAKAGNEVAPKPSPPATSQVPAAAPVVAPSAGRAKGIVERVKALLRSPRTEWPVIADEAATPMEIYTGYVAPLAAIGAVALFAGQVAIGSPVPLIGIVRAGVAAGAASAVVMFVLSLAWVAALSAIVDALAPKFGGHADKLRALKVAAYSQTPALLAGILHVMPALGFLWIFAMLYGVYLVFVGVPVLMRCRREQALAYAIVVGLCAYLLFIVIAGLTTAVTGYGPELDA